MSTARIGGNRFSVGPCRARLIDKPRGIRFEGPVASVKIWGGGDPRVLNPLKYPFTTYDHEVTTNWRFGKIAIRKLGFVESNRIGTKSMMRYHVGGRFERFSYSCNLQFLKFETRYFDVFLNTTNVCINVYT